MTQQAVPSRTVSREAASPRGVAEVGAATILVVDRPSERQARAVAALDDLGCSYRSVLLPEVEREVARRAPEVVILGADGPPAHAELDCLRRLRAALPAGRLLFLASASSEDLAIDAFHAGADRYLRDPWTPAMLQRTVQAWLPGTPEAAPREEPPLVGGERLVGRSGAVRELRRYLARIAPTASNVLIQGETGTGKELAAELIHGNSERARGPLVCLNTAAIPDALLENELFGHERGAFTGAVSAQPGKLAAAEGGTVFLDEIGDVSLGIQAKLLRVIEGRSIFRLGGTRSQPVDVRFLAATNDDLPRAAAEGRFRRDLFYRLNVVCVHLPPLRDRREDIPLLIGYYLRRLNRELGRAVRALSPRAMEVLCGYDWPGNIRELRNVIEALLVNLAPEASGTVDVPPQVMRQLALALGAPVTERDRLLRALAETNWNKSRAAQRLCCSRMTLYRRMQRYNVGPGPES